MNVHTYIKEMKILAETTGTEQIPKQRLKDIKTSLTQTITSHLMTVIKEKITTYNGKFEKDDPTTVCRTIVLWICIHMDSALMELNPYTIIKNWCQTLHRMNLNNNEKAEAYRVWTSIKTDIENNQRDKIPSSWSDLWSDRVIKVWLKRG